MGITERAKLYPTQVERVLQEDSVKKLWSLWSGYQPGGRSINIIQVENSFAWECDNYRNVEGEGGEKP